MTEKSKKKLIFIQLNEINLDHLKKYTRDYNFKFFNSDFFKKLKTSTSEENYELLEPWIQWVSIFTGLNAKEHNVFRLGDSEKKKFLNIYKHLENKGYIVGAIGPMNLNGNLKNPAFFIPDPWSELSPDNNLMNRFITKTIKKFVNENSSKNKSILDYLKLLLIFIVYFRFRNIKILIKLLKNINKHWNKALLFEFIINNIHLKKIEKHQPDFSSIFFNSGAHIQHHYFFNSNYNDKIKNPEWYVEKNYDPIFDMFIFYDEILFEYMNNPKYDLILATGLRQVPYDRVKYYYRLRNHEKFLKKISIKFKKVIPKMSRDFVIKFHSFEEAKEAEDIFNQINRLNNKKIFYIDLKNNSIFVTLTLNDEITEEYSIKIDNNISLELSGFVNFIAIKNGMHDKKGYYYSNFENPSFENTQHVKKIFNVVDNYF